MNCGWDELLRILPQWMRQKVNDYGRYKLQELRIRCGRPVELVLEMGIQSINRIVTIEDIHFIVNTASQYSPWAASSISKGYLTAPGGHRIGLCGFAVMADGKVTGIREIESLCIRVARDRKNIAGKISDSSGSILIIGAPGWGKTTLLRDVARCLAKSRTVTVVDEREEIFPKGFERGVRMDVMRGVTKSEGIEMALRTMSPDWIAVDEITAEGDCNAILHASGCGVHLLATAHASSAEDLRQRIIYRSLLKSGVFQNLVILNQKKSFVLERVQS